VGWCRSHSRPEEVRSHSSWAHSRVAREAVRGARAGWTARAQVPLKVYHQAPADHGVQASIWTEACGRRDAAGHGLKLGVSFAGLPGWLVACLPACLLGCLLACLLACVRACLLACLLACLPACLLACLPARLLACLPARLLACLLARRSRSCRGSPSSDCRCLSRPCPSLPRRGA
jgi:hypothetical protein